MKSKKKKENMHIIIQPGEPLPKEHSLVCYSIFSLPWFQSLHKENQVAISIIQVK